jgi:hypothetical protein
LPLWSCGTTSLIGEIVRSRLTRPRCSLRIRVVQALEAAPPSLWRAARDGARLLLVFHALRYSD